MPEFVNVFIEEIEASDEGDNDGDGDSLLERCVDTEIRLLAVAVVVRLADVEYENTFVVVWKKEDSDVAVIDTKGDFETLADDVVEGE